MPEMKFYLTRLAGDLTSPNNKPLKEAMELRDWLPLGLWPVMKSLNFNFVFMMNAKSFCKLYFKQQETMSIIGLR